MLKIQSKNDYDTKTSDIESKYIITDDYNKITKNIADNSIKSRNLVNSAIAGFINNSDLDKKKTTLVTKVRLKAEQDKIIKLQ